MRFDRNGIRETCRLLFIVPVISLILSCPGHARTEGVPDPRTVPAGAGGPRMALEGGAFLPVGSWSEGFDPGISLGAGVDLPLRDSMEFGGRFSRIDVNRDDRVFFSWTAVEGRLAFYPPVDLSPFHLFVSAGGGFLKAAVEVGEGREEEWDILAGLGGGFVLPISDGFLFRCSALWQKVLAEGGGIYVGVGLAMDIF